MLAQSSVSLHLLIALLLLSSYPLLLPLPTVMTGYRIYQPFIALLLSPFLLPILMTGYGTYQPFVGGGITSSLCLSCPPGQ